MTPSSQLLPRTVAASLLFSVLGSSLFARELKVDARGGADYTTLAAAVAAAGAGDTLVIAKGSGPYRETLYIKQSGTAATPIVVEGNGETVTGFAPLVFQREGDTWTARLPQAFPTVIAFNGVRILQDAGGTFLGPVKLREDNRTVELLPGASPEGWEASARDCAVRVTGASHQVYRNLVATGGTNDGFNIHGDGKGLRFENITAANNLDEGFSAHDDTVCEILGGDFWGNDNGISNNLNTVMTATDITIHDNIGWGLGFSGNTVSHLANVQIWNNGMAQVRFESKASGTLKNVVAWAPSWVERPWTTYKESSTSRAAPTVFRGEAPLPSSELWQGSLQIGANPPPAFPKAKIAPPVATSITRPVAASPSSTPAAVTPAAVNASGVDVAALIRQAIKSGQPSLQIPAGIHRVSETILIDDARNLTIDGTGVTLVMTDGRRGLLRINRADRLQLRGFTLAYDPIRHTQATITRVAANSFDFAVQDGYPDLTPDYSRPPAHLFTAAGRRHPDAVDFYKPALTLATPRTGTATAPSSWPATLAAGDQVVFDRRELDRANAVEIRENKGPVLFEDFTVLDSPALGFAGRYCEAEVILRRVVIRPGPPPAGARQPRLFSTNADAVNFVQCRIGPRLEACDFSGMGDDSLNVHGYFLPVVRMLSPTVFLTALPNGPSDLVKPLRRGDALRIYEPGAFSVISGATFRSIRALPDVGDVTDAEMKVLYPIGLGRIFTVYQVELDAPAKLVAGQWFDCPAVNSGGFVVRDSYFHDHRGRGLRIMAGDGVVENNRFERLTKSAISVGPELGFWREAGWVKNLRITGNKIRDVGIDRSLAANGSYVPGAIGVFVHTQSGKPPYPPGNEDIVIENNLIEGSSVAGIHAYAAAGITIRGNTLRRTNLVRTAGSSDPVNHLVTTGPISTEGVAGVKLENNTVTP
ncbi:right-handed parallel beta-helix repeat-containing protein [Rariglobus hedericola]|uniref:Right handed beta helix domain-containing protein n=1 Tax=Rariglobus hedericola TaxID=2597822 RepID=A0A556QJG7_9BACT|nr:right-handed parallel beta-helix repeat-containing protein [Rariglobus hedericola]TSJ76795.1 hypothetical protein FPL22_11775 [Rariglobus hedericola]